MPIKNARAMMLSVLRNQETWMVPVIPPKKRTEANNTVSNTYRSDFPLAISASTVFWFSTSDACFDLGQHDIFVHLQKMRRRIRILEGIGLQPRVYSDSHFGPKAAIEQLPPDPCDKSVVEARKTPSEEHGSTGPTTRHLGVGKKCQGIKN
jgi:hypothetical protein